MKRDLAIAIAAPLLALAAQWPLQSLVTRSIWLLFYPAVFFSSRLTGFRGGVISTALSVVLVWYFFIPPQNSFYLESSEGLFGCGLFGVMGYLFSRTHEDLRRALAQVETRFQAIVEQAAVGITLVGLDGRFLLVNGKFCDICGYGESELLTKSFEDITHPDDLASSRDAMRRMRTGETKFVTAETRYVRKDGKPVWVDITSVLTRKPSGEPDHFIAVVENIDMRKQIDVALTQTTLTLEEAQRVGEIGDWEWRSADGGLRWSAEMFRLFERDPALGPLTRNELQNCVSPGGWARLSAAVDDCRATGASFEEDLEVALPSGKRRWVSAHGEAVRGADETVEKMRGVLQDITRRKLAEEEALAGRAKLEAAFASMTEAVFIADAEGKALDVNDAFVTMHRFGNKAECIKTHDEYPAYLEVFDENGQALPVEEWAVPRALRGETATGVERILRRKDTGERWIGSYNFAPIRNADGVIVGAVVTARDVTARKEMEARLKETSAALLDAQRLARFGTWSWDFRTNRGNWSDVMYDIHGRDPSLGPAGLSEVEEYFTPASRARFEAVRAGATAIDEPWEVVLELIRPAGDRRWVVARGRFERDDSGAPSKAYGSVQDVTERKLAEDELHEISRRLGLAQAAAQIGIWDWDLRADHATFNDEFYHLLGLPHGKGPLYEAFLAMVHPDDRARVDAVYQKAVATCGSIEEEFRIRRANDDGARWLAAKGRVEGDDAGKAVRASGAFYDVTNLKEAAIALKRSREEFIRAQEVGQIGWWRLELPHYALTWSDETYRLFGMPKEPPVTFERLLEKIHPGDVDNVMARWRAALEGEPYDIEHRIVVDGQIKWMREKAYLEFDAAGAGVGAFGIVQDVTERRKAELALAESEERLKLFIEHAPAALAMFDNDMRYIAASRRWKDDFAIGAEDVIGRSHYDLFPEIPQRWKDAHRRGLCGEVLRAEEDRFIRLNGSAQWQRWELRPWRKADGAIGGIVIFAEDITKLREANQALLALNAELEQRVAMRTAELDRARQDALSTNERLLMALTTGRIGTWDLDLSKRIASVNDAWREIMGVASDAPVTLDVVDQMALPEDLPALKAARDKAFDPSSGGVYQAVMRIRHRASGAVRWVSGHGKVHFNNGRPVRLTGMIRDVTDERLSEQTLRETARLAERIKESESRLKAVIEGAKDAIITCDETGIIQSVNAAGVRMFGYAPHEIIGKGVGMLVPEPYGKGHVGVFDRYARSGEAAAAGREFEGRCRDGKPFPLELTISEAQYDETRLFVGFIRDLTAQRAAEAQVEQLQAERVTAIGGMAVALAHEINQPFLASVAYLDTARGLQERDSSSRSRAVEQALDLAAGQIVRAGQIIAHLREFASSGEPDKTFQSLHELILKECALVADDMKRANIEMTLRLDAKDDRVLVDKLQIRQVLVNLMRNARQAMSESTPRKLTIATAPMDGETIRVDVIDSGVGLSQETRANLFEPFVSSKDHGMGVGLSISRSIIRAHYGELWAEPNASGGATFSFSLPSASAAAAED